MTGATPVSAERELPATVPGGRFAAVAIDLDGTLIDTAPDLAGAINAMLHDMEAPPLDDASIRALIGHGIESFVQRAVCSSLGEDAAAPRLAGARTLFYRHYAAHIFDRSTLYPGVLEGLEALRAAGITTLCITNKHSAFAGPLLDEAGLGPYFAQLLCADEPYQRKPAPALLLDAAASFDIDPRDLLMVGDSPVDIEAARRAGCAVAAVDYGYQSLQLLQQASPDWIIGSLAELPGLQHEPAGTPGAYGP